MKNNWSPKEIAIFNGVLKLARSGADITKITSQQIASAAGMGKATIYDYFATKEDIIFGALGYSMSRQAAEFAAAMENTPDFAHKMDIIYNGIIDRVTDTGSIFHQLLQLSGGPHGTLSETDGCAPLRRQLSEFIRILYGVLSRGYSQGVLKTDVTDPANMDYVRMVFFANAFSVVSRSGDKLHPQHRETIVANAYKMLVKALG